MISDCYMIAYHGLHIGMDNLGMDSLKIAKNCDS